MRWCTHLVVCDAAQRWQLGIQDPATAASESMLFFHNYLVIFLAVIGVAVCYVLAYIIKNFNRADHEDDYNEYKILKFSHSSALEIIWTIIPSVLLILVAIPSFNLLYSLDEIINPNVTLKIIGHQWYWSYEYSDYGNEDGICYDSYMLNESDLTFGSFRLLEVDNRVVLPRRTHIRLLITSSDVLHSWAIPSFGIKIDACPGRLSQISLYLKRMGVYYGQCSEICGINHGFMPIVVRVVGPKRYIKWLNYRLAL